ncbi:MAG TPA: ABC transporter permease, partial [Geobacteraceae bacterium]
RQESLASVTAFLEKSLPGTRVREVRQVTRTSASLLKKVQLLMGLVTAVVLAASAASVTGTMSTTVLERGREIGLIKAVGATRWSAVLLFAAEACLLGVAGGVAGCGIGTLIAEMISRSVFSVSIEFIPLAVPISVATGLLIALAGNLGPLLSVYRLDPVQSLRGE